MKHRNIDAPARVVHGLCVRVISALRTAMTRPQSASCQGPSITPSVRLALDSTLSLVSSSLSHREWSEANRMGGGRVSCPRASHVDQSAGVGIRADLGCTVSSRAGQLDMVGVYCVNTDLLENRLAQQIGETWTSRLARKIRASAYDLYQESRNCDENAQRSQWGRSNGRLSTGAVVRMAALGNGRAAASGRGCVITRR